MLNHTDAVWAIWPRRCQTTSRPRPVRNRALVRTMLLTTTPRGRDRHVRHRPGRDGLLGHLGKALGQPVYRLLGGAVRDQIKAYANGWYTVERTPDEFHAARRLYRSGYRAQVRPLRRGLLRARPRRERALHLPGRSGARRGRPGRRDPRRDARALQPRDGHRDGPRSNASTRHGSRSRSRRKTSALKKVADAVRPVATGERIHTRYEYRELFELQAGDIIQPDITHFGGILETQKLAAWADTYYVLVAPHNVGGPVATAANLHLAACTAQLQDPGALQRLRRGLGQDAAPGTPRSSTAISPARSRASASP